MFHGPFEYSIVKRAQEKKQVLIALVNIRDFGIGKHKTVDDTPYGGGIGMLLRVDVVSNAISAVRDKRLAKNKEKVILLGADGTPFVQNKAKAYASLEHLILVCGHYEGIDERIRNYVDEVITIGDFVVTGGEIPAMLITDAVIRLVGGVLKTDATRKESFSEKRDENGERQTLLEYPQYTKPPVYEKRKVPEILLSGDHKKIELWRQKEAKIRTEQTRSDLLKKQ